jgi:hypothetical protein
MQRCFDRVIALVPIFGVLSCSDPVPASSAVGLTVNVTQSASCPITTGLPDDIGNPPPDSTGSAGVGTRIFDGEGGVGVQCSVRAAGNDSYTVSASISSTNPRVAMSIQNATVTAGAGMATIGLSTAGIGITVQSPPETPCTLNVVSTNEGLKVKAGAIWVRYNCSKLINVPSPICGAYGEVVLENCSK